MKTLWAPAHNPSKPAAQSPTRRTASKAAWLGSALGLCAALLAFAPAAWVTPWLGHATGGQWRLEAPQGTVWQGSAFLHVGKAPAANSSADPSPALPHAMQLYWHIAPFWQDATPRLGITLQAPCCLAQAVRVAAWHGHAGWQAHVPALQWQWPAAMLSALGAPWNTLALQGVMRLHTPGLTFAQQAAPNGNTPAQWLAKGQAHLMLDQMSTALATVRPLGDYQLTLSPQNGLASVWQLQASTLRGALQFQGTGTWRNNAVQFRGEAQANPGFEQALSNLLNIVGQRDGVRSLISIG